jgi:FAD/FMN-containing dehydrogenase
MAEVPASYLEDASGYKGAADSLYRPATPKEAAEMLGALCAAGTPVTLSGAGTGVTGGRVPHAGAILSLERLQRLEIYPGYAVAGAGVRLAELQAAAAVTRQFYAPDPTEMTASVGGSISTNASGSRSFLYGATRRHVRAVLVALADGTLRWLRRGEPPWFPVPYLPSRNITKHATGYWLRAGMDACDLFIGSEGTLGAVLEAELTLLPVPEALLTGVVFFPSEDEALEAVEAWRGLPQLRMLEWFDVHSLRLLRERVPEVPAVAGAALLVEQQMDGLAGDPVDDWVERLDAAGALGEESWFGDTAADRERFRRFRHTLPEIVNERVRLNGFQKMNTDLAVPIAANREMMASYRRRLDEEFPTKSVIFGHVGDAHVHVNLLPETPEDVTRGAALLVEFARQAVVLGGTVSAEHGLGKKKAHLLAIEYSPGEIAAMCAVKRCLDPGWLLGRGTLLAEPALHRAAR